LNLSLRDEYERDRLVNRRRAESDARTSALDTLPPPGRRKNLPVGYDHPPSAAVAAEAQETPAADPVGRQDFLIPRAGNQLLRSPAGYKVVAGGIYKSGQLMKAYTVRTAWTDSSTEVG
jgi:hypothetical protein